MKKILIIMSAALVLLTSCTPHLRHNYVIYIDNSTSISKETLNGYITVIQQQIVPNMNENDAITVVFIDECSMRLAERVFTLDLSSISFDRKGEGINNAKKAAAARLKRYLIDSVQRQLGDAILAKRAQRKGCGAYTDIINALNEGSSLVNRGKSFASNLDKAENTATGKDNYSYTNIIIIFSDMVNENRDKTLDFTQMGKFDQGQITAKIDELHKINKLPDLSDCKIFVYGATSTPESGSFANKQIENCKLFWQAYFNDCGAELKAYAYDSNKEITGYMLTEKARSLSEE